MNDSTISAVPPSPPQQTNNAAPVVVKIAELPPEIQPNAIITGQVISTDNKQTSLKTDQGILILLGALNVDVGQNVNVKIQNMNTPQGPNLVAELLNVSSDKVTKPAGISTQPIVDQPPIDPVIVHDVNAYEEYKPLQALVLQMPNILNDETLGVLVKSILQLPMQQPLPQGLQEGFAKLDQLVKLLSQSNLFPANTIQASDTKAGIQQNIISTLQQLLQNVTGKTAGDNPLLNQTPHQFIQLQTIQPGENLPPNILVNIKEQLANILQAQQSPGAIDKPENTLQFLIQGKLTAFVEKAGNALPFNMPKISEMFLPASNQLPALGNGPKLSPLFTLPAIGLVLGQPTQEIPQLNNANLVLMITPSKQDGEITPQHLIALLAPEHEETHAPLLPGSLIVAALKPQSERTTSFAVLPQELAPLIIENFAPLHPSLGDNWPALDDLWQQIQAQTGSQQSVQNPVQQIIPSPTPQQLPPTMLFFMSLLKNDFTGQWISEKHLAGIEKLDKAALIKTLSQDLQAIKSRMEEAAPSDAWRPLPLPLQVGDQLVRLQWFYRHPEDNYESSSREEENTTKKRKTRFLLNVPKTILGDLQIDGLVQEKNLDLILRTENVLASHMETAIRGRYASALETTGMVGAINFQSGRAHYVHV